MLPILTISDAQGWASIIDVDPKHREFRGNVANNNGQLCKADEAPDCYLACWIPTKYVPTINHL